MREGSDSFLAAIVPLILLQVRPFAEELQGLSFLNVCVCLYVFPYRHLCGSQRTAWESGSFFLLRKIPGLKSSEEPSTVAHPGDPRAGG